MTFAGNGLIGGVLGSLPVLAYAAILWVFRLRGEGWRSAALGAAVCWGVFLASITEILSVPRLITRPALALAWLSLGSAGFAYGWVIHRSSSRRNEAERREERLKSDAQPLNKMELSLLFGTGLLVALVGVTAILSAPNTWDAMAYHMSRIVQWMTNRDVSFYPTFYAQQLFLGPWSEYAMLHLDVLYGGDRLVTLVEWSSMIGTILGVSLIARELGAGRRGQILAALACATIPNGILEASGAMNTYVVAVWIVVAVYYLLRWNRSPSWTIWLGISSAMGLAILTKGTAYVLLPCMVLACFWMGTARARMLVYARLPILLLVILVLNGPLFVRNYILSGSPLGFASGLGNDPERQYSNSHTSARTTFSNVARNLALHMGTPSEALNQRIGQSIMFTLQRLGIDANDKASTYRGGFHVNKVSTNESRAGNPLHLVLIGIVFILVLSRKIGDRVTQLYMLGLFGSFVLFCTLLRWQPWNSRFHLPLFALGMAVVGLALERYGQRCASGVALFLLLAAFPFALLNSLRPLAPWMPNSVLYRSRADSYFADMHDWWIESYQSTARAVADSGCTEIGVDSSLEDFDYPMFVLLGAGHGLKHVTYIGVNNLTSRYVRPENKAPCAIICLRCANAPSKWAEYRGVGGRTSVFGEVAVFGPTGDIANNETMHWPGPSQVRIILDQLDRYRESPRLVDLNSLEARVQRVGYDWPEKRIELKGRMNALYVGTVTLWRVRDSVDPLLKKGKMAGDSQIDPLQLMAAWEVTADWDRTIVNKVRELNELVDKLTKMGSRP